jgi:hypothetical protein
MPDAFVKACLNLNAVLPNLEELVRHDSESARLSRYWQLCIQFRVRNGPAAHIVFDAGACRVSPGIHPKPQIKLYFTSPSHFNRMMDGKANPVPLKGFTRLGFLTREFPKLTERLESYLKPTADLLSDPECMALNTRMTLYTAAFAARELALHDTVGRLLASSIPDGSVSMMVMPDGPAATLRFARGAIDIVKSADETPDALMQMDGMDTAHEFLNGQLDTFAAIASGRIRIRGRIPMIDALGTILDRVPRYLS